MNSGKVLITNGEYTGIVSRDVWEKALRREIKTFNVLIEFNLKKDRMSAESSYIRATADGNWRETNER